MDRKKDGCGKSNCDMCAHLEYDGEQCEYICNVNMDEDDMMNYIVSSSKDCPYFVFYDEYMLVRKQN